MVVATNHVLIVGAEPEATEAARTARGLGWDSFVFPLPPAPGRDRPLPEAIAEAAEGCGARGIYCADKWAAAPVAIAAGGLSLPAPAPETVQNLHDKLAFRRILNAKGLDGPSFFGASDLEDAETAVRDLGLPVVVKPADAADSRGAYRVDHVEELPLAVAKARRNSPSATLLLEEFLEGEAFAVDGVLFEGELRFAALIAREVCSPPFLFDTAMQTPPALSGAARTAILDETQAALTAIGLRDAVVHVELVLTQKGPRIVEVSTCVPRHIAAHLVPAAYGVNLLAEALRLALGLPFQEKAQHEQGAAICWIPSNSGIVAAVEGEEAARRVPGVADVVVTTKPGKRLGHAVDIPSRDAVGWVLATASTGQEALAVARTARDLCQIITRPAIL